MAICKSKVFLCVVFAMCISDYYYACGLLIFCSLFFHMFYLRYHLAISDIFVKENSL